MSDENNFIPELQPYKRLRPFRLFVKSNFPFIENTYESLDNYGLYCKVVEYLNTVIANENTVETNVQDLYNAFVNLNTYVSNFFDNLDVQDEVDNKLDEMVESGYFDNLITNYLKLMRVYNTCSEMLSDYSNIVNGMKIHTLGYYNINDGGSAYYFVTENMPESGYYETLSNNLYAILLTTSNYYNVLQLGLYNDGETDNNTKLYNILHNYNFDNISLFFPDGTYFFEKSSNYIQLPNITSLLGDKNSKIFFNDSEESGVSLFKAPQTKLTINNLNFESTFDTVYSSTNAAQLIYGTVENANTDVLIENSSFKNFRVNIMSIESTNTVIIRDSKYEFIGRDSNRFLKAKYSLVENCQFICCGDHIISTHGNKDNSFHIFRNNYCERTYGCGYLGGKNIEVCNNSFILPLGIIACGSANSEGGNTEVLNFHDNYIKQPLHCSYSGRDLFGIYHTTSKIFFNNNTFDDGNTEKADVITIGVQHLNVDVNKGMTILAIEAGYAVDYVQFNNNKIYAPIGPTNLGFGDTRITRGTINNLDMYNNVIENFYQQICTGSKLNWNVQNNYFNGDKQHLISVDGTFANSNALRIFAPYPVNFINNIIRNISGNYGINHQNIVLYQTDGKYMNPILADNVDLMIPYTESNGVYINDQLEISQEMPTSGYYRSGWYVKRRYTANDAPIGWYRLTTGNNHVLNTDWKAIYPKTSAE